MVFQDVCGFSYFWRGCTNFKKFICYGGTQFNKQVQFVHIDKGIEFVFETLFLGKGNFTANFYCSYTQQNERVDRKHRYILNVVHALFFQVSLPIQF